ncbi:autotransporter outer membrane beta-barrel domain-containing protein [Sphingomonas sp. ABOLF]|nr:autotransporter outer membrane beta-barrel domain-containing protein [Sphingomonas sp. ABOLF]
MRVTTPGTGVRVETGAAVSNTNASAIAVDVPVSGGFSQTVSIDVLGSVSASGHDAIVVASGTPTSDTYYSRQEVTLTLGEGASVTGTTALALVQSPGNADGTVVATVNNSGTLIGTGGVALLGNVISTENGYPAQLTQFSTITNRASGRIVGGILGPVETLSNAGSIDGGSRSALETNYADVTNSAGATIRSASTGATISGGDAYYLTVENAGTIENSGAGGALSGGTVRVINEAGGRITGSITAATSLDLVNAGTIIGDIIGGWDSNTIDSTAGRVDGSLTLGDGDDTLISRYVGSRTLATGFSGTIGGGGGENTQRVQFATDTSVTTPIDLATGFQQLVLAADAGVTATLEAGFSTPRALVLGGRGTVVNRATIDLVGTAVTDLGYSFGSSAWFRNEGSITASLRGDNYEGGVELSNNNFANTGSLTVYGGTGVSMSYNDIDNSGTITATGKAVNVFDGVLTNSGTIVSTGGIGVDLYGNTGYTGSNSGTIRGATFGAVIGVDFTNSGTISSAETGVQVRPYGFFVNAAGGVVSGGTGPAITAYGFNAGVANAGVINGDVVFSGIDSPGSDLVYLALPGGMLNGNLILGGGATLVTDLVNTGPGAFAGISGTVTAGAASSLRYAVNADASATLPAGAVGPFSTAGYQLANGATLSLTAPAGQVRTQSLLLAGSGSVDLDADIFETTGAAAALTSVPSIPYPGAPNVADGLSIVSRGSLAINGEGADPYSWYTSGVVSLSMADSFTNAGVITVNDPMRHGLAGVFQGASVTNEGRILLDGGNGIAAFGTVVNTGTIEQLAGGLAGNGVTFASGSLDNRGTIKVDGSAVLVGSYFGSEPVSVTNSGTLASTTGPAVTSTDTFYRQLTLTNLAGGTIAGGNGIAVQVNGAVLRNAGVITGTVDLGYRAPNYPGDTSRSYLSSTYIADGGTILGDLLFGDWSDRFVVSSAGGAVSGIIDGGEGMDLYIHGLATSGIVTLGMSNVRNFEGQGVEVLGTDTVATIESDVPVAEVLYLSGDGQIVNTATIEGGVYSESMYNDPWAPAVLLTSFTNQGRIDGGFFAATQRFANSGSVGSDGFDGQAVAISQKAALDFTNSGSIASSGDDLAVRLYAQDTLAITNSGQITGGGIDGEVISREPVEGVTAPAPAPAIVMTNAGTISATGDNPAAAVSLAVTNYARLETSSVTLDNSGTIEAGMAGGTALSISTFARLTDTGVKSSAITINNSGTIRANGGGIAYEASYFNPPYTVPASAISVGAYAGGTIDIANASGGVIEATGPLSTAIATYAGALDLTNAGTIRGGAGSTLANDDYRALQNGTTYLAGAVQTIGDAADSVINTGTIIGSIALEGGNDSVENRGTLRGDVFLGAGDDSFLQQASAILEGMVNGGDGTDTLIIDATGGGTVNGDQFVDFERFNQVGNGNVTYAGTFHFDTIGVSGGTVTVAAGETLTSSGATAITGSDTDETVVNNDTIAGSVTLAGGADRVVNSGAITGSVLLGDGKDEFVEGLGSSVAGVVDGGAGTDLYTVVLAGDRSGITARTSFEQLRLEGTGTLTLVADQNFDSIALAGTSLDLSLGGYTVGSVNGSDAAETLTMASDIARVALGGGNDALALDTARPSGIYDGGSGNDALRFTAKGPVTLAGTAVHFETISLAGDALTVAGTLGSTGDTLTFGGGDQALTATRGGTLGGTIDLGAGDDSFRLAAGAMLAGTVAGGSGTDAATLELEGERTLDGRMLTGFEMLVTEGRGQLSLSGTHSLAAIVANTDLAIATNGTLRDAQVRFGGGDNRFTIAGGFAGSVDGGAGNDRLFVSGGSQAAPIAFGDLRNIESYTQTAGFAQLAGTASLSAVELVGGRLVGQAGSVLTAPQILVGRSATFGSAGTINGDVLVAGTLSPGASPGTMTMNGDVTLASGSTSLFELSSAVSDTLVVNGSLSIAPGATLQLTKIGTLRPGKFYTLVTATDGISGRYATILKPSDLFGFVVHRADSIDLLGQFVDTGDFSPQVSRSIAYANRTLEVQGADSALFDALPALLTSTDGSNPAAFARLTPEPYASATQMSVDNALGLVDAVRGPSFAATGEGPRAFTFASALGQWHRLSADPTAGTSAARTHGYGFLGGIGYGDAHWSVGAFGGYRDNRQTIDALGARTKADGVVAGVQGRLRTAGGLGLSTSVLYDGGQATTTRTLPVGSATGRYDLHAWTGDLRASYEVALPGDWAVTPQIGLTYLRVTRDGVAEAGGSPFALAVARNRHVAGFADGAIAFGRSEDSGARFRPFVSLGLRYQIEGLRTEALGGYAGGGMGLEALGAARSRMVGTASAGAAYRLKSGVDLFATAASRTGSDDHQESVSAGVRLNF